MPTLASAIRVNKSDAAGLDSASAVIAIVPHDSNPLAKEVRAIRATGAGNITFVGPDGTDDVIAVAAGETVNVRAWKVKNTGTTATGLQGLV